MQIALSNALQEKLRQETWCLLSVVWTVLTMVVVPSASMLVRVGLRSDLYLRLTSWVRWHVACCLLLPFGVSGRPWTLAPRDLSRYCALGMSLLILGGLKSMTLHDMCSWESALFYVCRHLIFETLGLFGPANRMLTCRLAVGSCTTGTA